MAEQMQHTPGPWRVVEKGRGWREIWAGNRAVVRADGYYSAKYEDYECGVAISEPNARRIVACVNACDGIPTEALEAGVVRKLIEAATETALALLGRIEALERRDSEVTRLILDAITWLYDEDANSVAVDESDRKRGLERLRQVLLMLDPAAAARFPQFYRW